MALSKAQLQEKLGQLKMGIYQLDQAMNRAKVGTPEFNKASANYKAALKTLNDYNAQLAAIEKDEKAKAAAAKKAADLKRLQDEKARAEAKGQNTGSIDKKINEVKSGKTAQQIADEKAAADKAAKAKADADAKAKAAADKAAKAKADKAATDKATADKAAADKAAADKTAAETAAKTSYISALKETFKTLPKEYKAEIDSLFAQAAKGAWDEKAFIAELEKTKWWNSELPSLQAYFIESHDPRNAGTFAEKMRNKMDAISASLEKLGINATQVDPITGKYFDNTKVIQGIASQAMLNGWDDNQLMQHLGETAQLHFSGGGTIGSSVDTIKRQGLMYGINIDDNYLKSIQYSLLDPTDGRDAQYYMNELKNQAIDAYKPFAESLKGGRTLYEVTNNYRTKMANLLEIDPSNVTWKDLMGKVIDPTTGNARMESEFIKQLKQDPMWQYTKNAKETYSNMALDLMKQFGFVG